MLCRTASLNHAAQLPNVIFTPHTAFYTDVNVASMVESAFKALRAYGDGQPYSVGAPVMQTVAVPICRCAGPVPAAGGRGAI